MSTLTDDRGPGWQARLTLGFTRRGERTLLEACRHHGPLRVQRPFYPEAGGTCHVYILHPPGGVVGGDVLIINAELAPGAQALLTTPAAGKFYRSSGAMAAQIQTLRAGAGAALEWLPQENIVFSGARVRALTRVELSGDASFMGWEILCLGRPAGGETFRQGQYSQGLEIWRDGLPLYLEQGRYQGGAELLHAAWGLQGFPVIASLVCVSERLGLAEAVRSAVQAREAAELFAVSQLKDILVCRYLGPSAARARQLFIHAWAVLRPAVLGKPITIPRIWNT